MLRGLRDANQRFMIKKEKKRSGEVEYWIWTSPFLHLQKREMILISANDTKSRRGNKSFSRKIQLRSRRFQNRKNAKGDRGRFWERELPLIRLASICEWLLIKTTRFYFLLCLYAFVHESVLQEDKCLHATGHFTGYVDLLTFPHLSSSTKNTSD